MGNRIYQDFRADMAPRDGGVRRPYSDDGAEHLARACIPGSELKPNQTEVLMWKGIIVRCAEVYNVAR